MKFDFSEPWFFFHARKKSESQNFSELSEFFELLKVKFDFSGMFSNRVCIANRSFDSSDSTCFDRPDWAKPTLTATENLVFLGLGFLGPAGLENEAYFRNTVFPPPYRKKNFFFQVDISATGSSCAAPPPVSLQLGRHEAAQRQGPVSGVPTPPSLGGGNCSAVFFYGFLFFERGKYIP